MQAASRRVTRVPAGIARWTLAAGALVLLARCGGAPVVPSPPGGDVTLVGAGDIAVCGSSGTEGTARLLDTSPGVVFTAGDNAYYHGSVEDFRNCYDPTWGRHKRRTRPSPGNHEYEQPGALPYFAYFGANAGPVGQGYYSFDLQPWHVISLNSNVATAAGSPQLQWLREDLEGSRAFCTVAYWHHPLFSSGANGDQEFVREIWRMLFDFGVDVVINGHDHSYERFAPQDPLGRADSTRGVRQFVVGTGGAPLTGFGRTRANSETRASVFGVLKLTLSARTYDWEFVPIEGEAFRDFGSGACH